MSDETLQPEPTQTESSAPNEPTEQVSVQSVESTSIELPPQSLESPTETETPVPKNPNITVEKTPNTITITEVMEKPEMSKETLDSIPFWKKLLPKLKEKLNFRTEKRLAKILELAKERKESHSKGRIMRHEIAISNDDVEKLLHVSDASATNYLSKLVKRGKLRVSGPKNHSKYIPYI